MTISKEQRLDVAIRREKKGWEQKDLARAAGVTQPTISNIESGRTDQPRKVVWAKIQRALRMPGDADGEERARRFHEMVEGIIEFDADDEITVHAVITALRAKKKKPTLG